VSTVLPQLSLLEALECAIARVVTERNVFPSLEEVSHALDALYDTYPKYRGIACVITVRGGRVVSVEVES
jgi:hypothetical protein